MTRRNFMKWQKAGRCSGRRREVLSVLPSADGRGGKTGEGGGYDYFTTTLSISPLKMQQKINEIGEELAEIYKVPHLTSDFKKKNGYKRSIELSHEHALYRQNYCGCVFSKKEAWTENGWLLRIE